MKEIKVKKGEIIFKEGDTPDHIYLIKEGKVKVYSDYLGEEKVFAVLGTGEILGEMGVLSKRPRSASAMAVEDSILLKIDKEEVLELLNSNIILNLIVQSLINRIKRVNEILKVLTTCHEELRLLLFLIIKHFEEKKSEFEISEIKYYTDIKEKQIKNYLEHFQTRKILALSGKKFYLKNPLGLIEYTKYVFLQEKFQKKEKISAELDFNWI